MSARMNFWISVSGAAAGAAGAGAVGEVGESGWDCVDAAMAVEELAVVEVSFWMRDLGVEVKFEDVEVVISGDFSDCGASDVVVVALVGRRFEDGGKRI